MVVAYDAETRSRQNLIDGAKLRDDTEKAQVKAQMEMLAEERDVYKKSNQELSMQLHRVQLDRDEFEEKNAELEALLAAREKDHRVAIIGARRTSAEEKRALMGRAYEAFCGMKESIVNMTFLEQAEANIQLLDDMESKEDNFDLDAERGLLLKTKAQIVGADEVFNQAVARLGEILGGPPCELDITEQRPLTVEASSLLAVTETPVFDPSREPVIPDRVPGPGEVANSAVVTAQTGEKEAEEGAVGA